MPTKIKFIHIAYERNLPAVTVAPNRLEDVFPKIQNILINKGLVQRNLAFRWNPNGDGVNYVINETSNGKHAIASFTLTSVLE